jgi:transglutaminase-like putative cysteine protease
MNIQIGFDFLLECAGYTPMIFTLNVHPSRRPDLLCSDSIRLAPHRAINPYIDSFGNKCVRILAPPAKLRVSSHAFIQDSAKSDKINPGAVEHAVADLPSETLLFLLASRYCETDLLMDIAWQKFASARPGWARVQAICDFVHDHLRFDYMQADPKRGSVRAYEERRGVCRDFAHLAVTLCRCMNIPARYCTGYLGDIGVPPDPAPMDFSAWFEAYIGGAWYTFDARHNRPRIGRVLIARGRDAADVAICTSFGPHQMLSFAVTTREVKDEDALADLKAFA